MIRLTASDRHDPARAAAAHSAAPTASDRAFVIGYDLRHGRGLGGIIIGMITSLALPAIDPAHVADGVVVETATWFAGILAAYTIVCAALAPRGPTSVAPWAATVLFYGPVLVLPYVDALPTAFRALSLYVTVSIVVVVLIRYSGSEVVGIPRANLASTPARLLPMEHRRLGRQGDPGPWTARL